uniref:Uncharacterized protein n=1 Tax=Lotus japonicus TaxID=34305 RepID=I3SAU9_LOTJA|nr:unknown [Lotus japonicus]
MTNKNYLIHSVFFSFPLAGWNNLI